MKQHVKNTHSDHRTKNMAIAAVRLAFTLVFLSGLAAGFTGCGGTGSGQQANPPVFDQLTVLVPEAPGTEVLGQPPLSLDISATDHGYMTALAADDGKRKNVQVVSEKSGVVYSYFLESGESAVIPFTDGEGSYLISCYQQTEDSLYAALSGYQLEVSFGNPFYPWLYPNQYVNFSPDSEACILAQEMLPEGSTDIDGLNAVYDYVTTHVVYDEDKARTIEAGYIPDVDETLRTGTGICFDYAALMTAMLRARDIPCRLVTGYSGTIKHAWIDAWIQNKGWIRQAISFDGRSWNRLDPTFCSVSEDEDFILAYIGDGDNYNEQYAH